MKWKQRKKKESQRVLTCNTCELVIVCLIFFAFVIGHGTGINCIHWRCSCRMRFPMTSHEPSRGVVC